VDNHAAQKNGSHNIQSITKVLSTEVLVVVRCKFKRQFI